MQNIQRFSSNTKKALKSYVYGLRYPCSEKQYFYIGKGTGNRVFSHINQKIKRGVKDPKYDVIQSLQNLGGSQHSLTVNSLYNFLIFSAPSFNFKLSHFLIISAHLASISQHCF